ncbi:Retrovirus-related Pol polyprotein from transposon 297 family [Gossypium australe]|uniref:Retrovirus-related Pol polyprotein from transposon 297 family n=1 Tax=Gossypium australe TaxID=47621 RepID=A0A5B6V917_9ROSI|nr:Retrovirus-related Pol polyprotein from transposon 297 family [Gossypium australe]
MWISGKNFVGIGRGGKKGFAPLFKVGCRHAWGGSLSNCSQKACFTGRKGNKARSRKLLSAGFIKEVEYPNWVSNVVMVKKASGKWKMCIDFTNLNKACPNDNFPLPSINRLVDACSGHRFMSFMDAFSNYNQISIAPEDHDNKASIKNEGLFCYQAFVILRAHNMKLNSEKCVSGVKTDKFLGFLGNKGKLREDLGYFIYASPEDYQGYLTSNGEECQVAFEKLKLYFTSPPLLIPPRVGKIMYLYLTTSDEIAVAVLIRVEGVHQFSVYYVSKALQNARKLRSYFQAHPIKVMMNQPIKDIPSKGETSSVAKSKCWAIYIDGSIAKTGSRAGVLLVDLDKNK